MPKIYGDILSGNCYKIKLLANFIDYKHEWIHVDILKGESHTPDFLHKNTNGKIPVLECDDGRCLSESNAILFYMAQGTDFFPKDLFAQAQVLQWQNFEQYSHEPYIAVARYIEKYLGLPENRKTDYERTKTPGYKALEVMEHHLKDTMYFVGDTLTIADISLFAYTHVCHEGGFTLENYPHIRRWIETVKSAPNFVGMC